jgi:hypothetical protein
VLTSDTSLREMSRGVKVANLAGQRRTFSGEGGDVQRATNCVAGLFKSNVPDSGRKKLFDAYVFLAAPQLAAVQTTSLDDLQHC